jgi:hypothetical protein
MTREEREEIETVVADAMGEQLARLEAKVLQLVLDTVREWERPTVAVTPKGEFFFNGKLSGDLRPVVVAALKEALPKREDTDG